MANNWFEEAKARGMVTEGNGVNLEAVKACDMKTLGRIADEGIVTLLEVQFQKLVVGWAESRGYMVAHCRKVWVKDGDTGRCHYETPMAPGWPDLVLVHPDKAAMIVAELKVGDNTTTEAQDKWLNALRLVAAAASHDGKTHLLVCLWNSKDWREIIATLDDPVGGIK